jgi:hypothetical protein
MKSRSEVNKGGNAENLLSQRSIPFGFHALLLTALPLERQAE